MKKMRVLVTGGRGYANKLKVWVALSEWHVANPISMVIQGGASGTDYHAESWARANDVPCLRVPAKWDEEGTAAGPLRNGRMLDHEPDVVFAFPGNRGTADMVAKAEQVGIEVRHFS